MAEHYDILEELKDFERRTSISPAAVCRKATGNPRMFERLVRRLKQTKEQVAAIRAEMDRHRGEGGL